MSHLNNDEVRSCVEMMFLSLYGKELQERWFQLKRQTNFMLEKDFVIWMLDIVEDSLLRKEDDELMFSLDGETVVDNNSEVKLPEDGYPPTSPCSVIPEDLDIKDDSEVYSVDDEEDTMFYSDKSSASAVECNDLDNSRNNDTSVEKGTETKVLFNCNLCSASFKRRFDLNLHESTVHFDGKQYPCSKCAQVFNSRSDRINHLQQAHDMQMFVCDQCDKVFANRTYLSHHKLNIHNRCKVFRCSRCVKTFSSASNLRRHEKTAHLGIRFTCFECNSLFSSKQKLLYHKKRCSPNCATLAVANTNHNSSHNMVKK